MRQHLMANFLKTTVLHEEVRDTFINRECVINSFLYRINN